MESGVNVKCGLCEVGVALICNERGKDIVHIKFIFDVSTSLDFRNYTDEMSEKSMTRPFG